MKNKIFALCTGVALALGSVLVGVAGPASAHTGGLSGVAECTPEGTYTVHWTYDAVNVPEQAEADAHIIKHLPAGSLVNGVDGQFYFSTWTDHQVNNPGVPVRKGNFSFQFDQTGIPGTSTSATVQSQVDWNDGASDNDPEKTVDLPGDCTPPVVVPTKPAPEVSSNSVETKDCATRAVTIVTTTTTVDYAYNEATNTWDKLAPVVTTGNTTREVTPEECPLPPGEAVPAGTSSSTCDSAYVYLTNVGENIKTASFTILVDGKFFDAPAVFENETYEHTFPFKGIDGSHTVEVYESFTWTLITSEEVTNDCVVPPTEEPPTESVPVVPTYTDPCGPNNILWFYQDTAEFTYKVTNSLSNGQSTIVALNAKGDVVDKWSARNSGEECSTPAAVAPANAPTAPVEDELAETGVPQGYAVTGYVTIALLLMGMVLLKLNRRQAKRENK